MARRKKEIEKDDFERLCALQCTRDEICAWFDVTDKTLNGWCRRTYGASFSAVFRQKRVPGKVSLSRAQYKTAMAGNPTMLVWLGRNWLGQSEQAASEAQDDDKQDGLSKSLQELAEEMDNDG